MSRHVKSHFENTKAYQVYSAVWINQRGDAMEDVSTIKTVEYATGLSRNTVKDYLEKAVDHGIAIRGDDRPVWYQMDVDPDRAYRIVMMGEPYAPTNPNLAEEIEADEAAWEASVAPVNAERTAAPIPLDSSLSDFLAAIRKVNPDAEFVALADAVEKAAQEALMDDEDESVEERLQAAQRDIERRERNRQAASPEPVTARESDAIRYRTSDRWTLDERRAVEPETACDDENDAGDEGFDQAALDAYADAKVDRFVADLMGRNDRPEGWSFEELYDALPATGSDDDEMPEPLDAKHMTRMVLNGLIEELAWSFDPGEPRRWRLVTETTPVNDPDPASEPAQEGQDALARLFRDLEAQARSILFVDRSDELEAMRRENDDLRRQLAERDERLSKFRALAMGEVA